MMGQYILGLGAKVPVIFDENYKFEIGKGVELKAGKDVTIVATGVMVIGLYKQEKTRRRRNICKGNKYIYY